nr:hypothetical protein [Ruminococcus albus]
MTCQASLSRLHLRPSATILSASAKSHFRDISKQHRHHRDARIRVLFKPFTVSFPNKLVKIHDKCLMLHPG